MLITGNLRTLFLMLIAITFIGSMLIANDMALITFSEFRILYPGHSKQYFGMFTLINFAFLIIMTVAAKLFFL